MAFKIFKKLNTKAMILGVSACAFGMSILLPTMSWFNSDTSSPISVDGNIHGSYFESGDGTAASPFEIARPIQLYYLSWLQEMGYFNEAVLDENTGEYVLKQQYHFILSKDLDMDISNDESYVIPPIGTVKYPFVGSFDGNGHVITDLTISNDYSEYTKDPRHPSGSNTHSDSYEILGLFGVLGTTESTNVVPSSIIDSDGTIHELLDTNNDNVLVTYTTAGNYVQNFYLDNVTIVASTDSAHALAGAVAGYSNATVANVGILGASLSFESGLTSVQNIGTTNLSEYTAFGFVEPNYKRTVDLINEQVYDPKATTKTYVSNSSGTSWGGSVDMAKMLQRIYKSRFMDGRKSDGTIPEYPKKETRIYDENGDLIDTNVLYDNRHYGRMYSSFTKPVYYSSDKTVAADSEYVSGETIGSYYFINQSGNTGENAPNTDHKAYVGGLTNISESTAKTVYELHYDSQIDNCYYVRTTSDNTGNYTAISNTGTLTTTANSSNAAKWHLKNGALVAHAEVSETINGYNSTNNDLQEKVFYLNYNGTSFSVGESSVTDWSIVNGQLQAEYKDNVTYAISANNNYRYLTYSGSIGSTSSLSSATEFTISPTPTNGSTVTISCVYNRNTYYIRATNNGLEGNTSTGSWTVTTSGNQYYFRYSNDRYLRLNNTTWTTTSTQSNNYTLITLTERNYDLHTQNFAYTGTTEAGFTLSSGITERSGQPGYIPLTVNGDSLKGNDNPFNYQQGKISVEHFYTSPMNTGYVVGGYYDRYNGQNTTTLQTGNFGDVRISQYDIARISSSYSNGSFTGSGKNLYTINDSCYNGNNQLSPITFNTNGVATSNNYSGSLNFVKFSTALQQLEDTLDTDSTYVSGIHFMNSSIGMDKLITADRVLINNEYKDNYQMPEDSVDFKLKEKGYINFFAGNYHNDNNSFFALHKIERDANDNIISMEKIKYVYKNNDDPIADNIYLYENGEWSDDSTITNRPTDKTHFYVNGEEYVFAFDTRWIGVNATLIPDYSTHQSEAKRIYYFEIPVNEGEYALGSCSGGCGGYLIYLDISAAAQTVNRKTLNEMFIVDTISGDIPYGVQYIGTIPDFDENADFDDIYALVRSGILNIDDTNSYYGTITPNADGTYTISRNGNTITVTSDPAIISKYIGDGMTLSGGSVGGQTQRRIRRITDYDYNTITHNYIRQITTIVTEGSGSTAHNYATTTIEYNETSFTSNYTLIAKYSYDWVGDGPTFTTGYYLHISNNSSGIEVIFRNVNAQLTLTVEYLATNFELTSGMNGVVSYTQVPAVVSQNNPYPTITIAVSDTIESSEWTKWYDFTKSDGGYGNSGTTVTPQVIGTFKYTREANEVVTENFIYSDYGCLAAVTDYPEKETVITDSGYYIFEFGLSGSSPTSTSANPAVTVYYIGEGVFYIRTASGSEYILFTNSGNTQPQPNP